MNKNYFKSYSIADMTRTPEIGGFYRLIKNMYWLCDEEEKILFYNSSPQCNMNPPEIVGNPELNFIDHPAVSIKFLENVWVPEFL